MKNKQRLLLHSKLLLVLVIFFISFLLIYLKLPVKREESSVEVNYSESLPERIIIPSVSIDIPVKKALIIRGYWQVFYDSAAWGDQSGLPGKVGNQVIFAHAREGLFLPLKDINIGADIYVLTADKWYSYQVKETKSVKPNQIETVAPTKDETLTLYTCSGFNDINRLVVIAKREDPLAKARGSSF